MQLITWMFQGLQIPMMKDGDGVLYCTSKALCSALGLTDEQLRKVYQRHGDRLHPLRVTDCPPNGSGSDISIFLQSHKSDFAISRVSKNMLLWPLDEALGVAFHVHTEVAWKFHKAAIQLIKQQASTFPVSMSEYQRLVDQVNELQTLILQTRPSLEDAASAAGAALYAQRGTKSLRALH